MGEPEPMMYEDDQRTDQLTREQAEEKVERALKEAETARIERRFNDGIQLLLDAMELNVKTDVVFYRLGNIYYDSGDLGRAEYTYRRALEINPYHVNAHNNLAVIYKKTGRVYDSVRFRKRAVRLEAGGRLGRRFIGDQPPKFPDMPSTGGLNIGGSPTAMESKAVGGNPAGTEIIGGEGGAPSNGVAGATKVDDEHLEAPEMLDRESLMNDPEFRRWGKQMALKGFLFMLGIGAAYLFILFVVGRWIF